MKNQNRGSFQTSFGTMMAVTGSAVGLGNIWRFPFLAGQNGGGAFLVVYIALVILVGLPLVLGEFTIGRSTHKGVVGSFKELAPKTKWYGVGYLTLITGFTILGFYSVIAGWTGRFLVEAVQGNFNSQSAAAISASFKEFTNSGYLPILYSVGFIAFTGWIVARGVEKGIEKFNKILMPALVVLLVLLCINSATLGGFADGMSFLFKPDFSKINGGMVLDAMGQVFFTLSVGMGVMLTYSSYVTKEENMPRSKATVAIIDTSIAIISGIAIFPAVFTFGIAPTEGPQLVFIALPSVFAQMPFGAALAFLFFAMLLIAALTSAISIYEMIVAYCIEEFSISRLRAVIYLSISVAALSVLASVSQIEGSSLTILGLNVFDFLDTLSSNYLLIAGGLFVSIFVGWVFRKDRLYNTFTSHGKYAVWLFKPFVFIIRYIVPVGVSLIFLSKIGLI